jgi:hypothetical protein
MLKSIALVTCILLPISARAADEMNSTTTAPKMGTSKLQREVFDPETMRKMPRWFRMAIFGGSGLYPGEKNFENDNSNLSSVNANIMLAVGRQTFSFEIGGAFLNVPYAIGVKDEFGTHRALVNVQYVGVPVILKYNYIERPLASFFLKTGAIPVAVVNQSQNQVTLKDGLAHDVVLPKNDILAVAGFGGTSEISSSTAFIVDFTAFYGTTASDSGSHVQGLTGSVGLSFEI